MSVCSSRGFCTDDVSISDSASKDLFVGKGKKESVGRKLLLLILVGLCGLSICLIRTHQRRFNLLSSYHAHRMDSRIYCQGHSMNSTERLQLHYPVPKSFKREECTCTPVHYFVILSMQRSGSGWFETLLNNHTNISSHGEVFAGRERHKNLSTILNKLDHVFNLDYKSSAAKNECTAAVGFKWMLNQGVMEYHREILLYFKRKGVSVIFLLRKNLLRRLVSILANAYDREMKLLNGTHKSHVHSREEAETLASFKPIINHQSLVSSFHRVLEVTHSALQIFNSTRHTVVYYEELLKNKKILIEVQEFLGVPTMKLESQQVKIHTRLLSQQIQNWDSVVKALKGTPFEEFLEENEYV